ncbi:MAG: transposase [Candidatus Omnitrophica bacterium]|nr:transposase [Candidatus Omnitrophota bacterium]
MSRSGRLLYDDAIYHIINRGHNKQGLFKGNSDYVAFKEIIAVYKTKFDFKIFNYCIMKNHFHLLLQILKAKDLPHIMQSISQAYARYHKRKYHNVGYLYQGRYKGLLIEKDEYLLECARYIERNPLRACIVKDLSAYPWSSYNYYAKGRENAIINRNICYDSFGRTEEERQREYIKYIETPRPYESILDEAINKMKL